MSYTYPLSWDINSCFASGKTWESSGNNGLYHQPDCRICGSICFECRDIKDSFLQMGGTRIKERGKHLFGMITVGDKDQIVIPAKARKLRATVCCWWQL